MTTIRQKMMSMLDERGMFEADAKKIIECYLASEAGKPMAGRMDESTAAYPSAVLAVTWMGVNAEALTFIDANCPQHWARPLFAPGSRA